MTLLLLSLIALALGPVLAGLGERSRSALRFFDGFLLVAVGGLALLDLLPDGLALGGWWGGVAAIAGLAVPFVIERSLSSADHRGEASTVLVLLAALVVHAAADGAALATPHGHSGHAGHGDGLAIGVIMHRMPIGLLLWSLVVPTLGQRVAIGLIGSIALATVAGYAVGAAFLDLISETGLGIFQAFVAGSLLHALLHGHGHPAQAGPAVVPGSEGHSHDHSHGDPCDDDAIGGRAWAGAIGSAAGLMTLYWLAHPDVYAEPSSGSVLAVFVALAAESAPALLLAYVGAGLLRAFLRPPALAWMSRGGSGGQALRGVAFGLPLPICSCGVLPLYESLSRSGASNAAAIAFLIATPELGLDAVLLSWPLLGPELTMLRVAAAFVLALAAGVVVSRGMKDRVPEESMAADVSVPVAKRVADGLRFGLGELVDTTLPWIVVGLVTGSLLEPYLASDSLAAVPAVLQVPLVALVGMPTYVCASGATPLVAMLLQKGLTPGAAIAFLMTGPATNVTTFGVLSRLHGRKHALTFAATVAGGAMIIGYLTDALLGSWIELPDLALAMEHGPSSIEAVALVTLGVLFAASVLRQGPRGFVRQVIDPFDAG